MIKALKTLAGHSRQGAHTDKQWEMLYGQTQITQGGAASA